MGQLPAIHAWDPAAGARQELRRGRRRSVVLLIRGELLHRYPDALIYAVEGEDAEGGRHRGEAAALPRAHRARHHVPRLRPDRDGGARRRATTPAGSSSSRSSRPRRASGSTRSEHDPLDTWNDLAWTRPAHRPGAHVRRCRRRRRRSRPGRRRRGGSTARTWPASSASGRCGSRIHARQLLPPTAAMKTLREVEALVGALPAAVAAGRAPAGPGPDALRHARRQAAAARPRLPRRAAPRRPRAGADRGRGRVGRKAWRLAWPAEGRAEAERLAWTQLAERFGRRRAEWIARKLPADEPEGASADAARLPGSGPRASATRDAPVPSRARLPDRWVVMGYQGGQRVLLEVGAPIPSSSRSGRRSTTTPLPDAGPTAAARRGHALARRLRRGREGRHGDPDRAASRARDSDVRHAARVRRRGASLAAGRGRDGLEALLDAQRYTRGLAFVAPGTPTNNTGGGEHGLQPRRPRRGRQLRERRRRRRRGAPTARSRPGCSASAAPVLAGLEGAARTRRARRAPASRRALWPVTGGYYLDQIMGSPEGRRDVLAGAARRGAPLLPRLRPRARARCRRCAPAGSRTACCRRSSLDLLAAPRRRRPLRPEPALPARRRGNGAAAACRGSPAGRRRGRARRDPPHAAGVGRLPGAPGVRRPVLRADGRASRASSARICRATRSSCAVALEPRRAEGLVGSERFFDLIPGDDLAASRGPLVQRGGEPPGAALARTTSRSCARRASTTCSTSACPTGFRRGGARRAALPAAAALGAARVRNDGAAHPRPPGPLPDEPLPRARARRHRRRRRADADPHAACALLDRRDARARAPHARRRGARGRRARGAAREPRAPRDAAGRRARAAPRRLHRPLLVPARRLDHVARDAAPRRAPREGDPARARARRVRLGARPEGRRRARRCRRRRPARTAAPLFAAREPGGFCTRRRWRRPRRRPCCAAATSRTAATARRRSRSTSRRSACAWRESLLDGIRQGQPLGALLGYRFERGLHERQLDRFIAGLPPDLAARRASTRPTELCDEVAAVPPGRATIRVMRPRRPALTQRAGRRASAVRLPPTRRRPSSSRWLRRRSPTASRSCASSREGRMPFERLGDRRSARPQPSSRPSWPRSTQRGRRAGRRPDRRGRLPARAREPGARGGERGRGRARRDPAAGAPVLRDAAARELR